MAAPAIVSVLTRSDSEEEPAMYSLDANINTAVERQAERVRGVQAYGLSHKAEAAALPGQMGRALLGRVLAGQAGRALAIACVVIATLLLAYVAR
jgi:hypothetical protein